MIQGSLKPMTRIAELLPEALKQTSAEPLDCSVRLARSAKGRISGRCTSGRAAARGRVGKLERSACSAATLSGMRGVFKASPVIEQVPSIRSFWSEDVGQILSLRSTWSAVFLKRVAFLSSDFSAPFQAPNKAPEPTPTAVTPRAVEVK
jgi:hypothetical protein